MVLQQVVNQVVVARTVSSELLAGPEHAPDHLPVDSHLLNLPLVHRRDELRIRHSRIDRLSGAKIIENRHQNDGDDYPQNYVLQHVIHGLTSSSDKSDHFFEIVYKYYQDIARCKCFKRARTIVEAYIYLPLH